MFNDYFHPDMHKEHNVTGKDKKRKSFKYKHTGASVHATLPARGFCLLGRDRTISFPLASPRFLRYNNEINTKKTQRPKTQL